MNPSIRGIAAIPSRPAFRQRLCVTMVVRVLSILMLSSSAALQADQFGDFSFTSTGASATITGYTGPGGAVSIPAIINGQPVTGIGYYAFDAKTNLTNVAIPGSVTDIGEGAFADCSNLTSVTIPNGVTNIGGSAFEHCFSLISISIPATVTGIGEHQAFSDCSDLVAITVDAANSYYSSVDGVLFDKAQTTLIQFPGGKSGSFTIPATVTSIGDWAFQWCHRLTGVLIPASVTSLGAAGFVGCGSLTAITVNAANANFSSTDGVLFDKNQTTLIQFPAGKPGTCMVPGSVSTIGRGAFAGCASLVAITVQEPNTFYRAVDGVLFDDDMNTVIAYPGGREGSYSIPAGVGTIGFGAFALCPGLAGITIPDGVTSIGSNAFYGCNSLASVAIPKSVSIIGDSAFSECTSLANVMLPSSLTTIGEDAFESCTSLTSVTIPNGVTSIGSWAFGECTNLAGVYFRGNAPIIGQDVFSGADNATAYHFARTTGWRATFGGRPTALWSESVPYNYEMGEGGIHIMSYTGPGGEVVIPETIDGLPVVGIGYGAFYGCEVLTSVTIPVSVTHIAFEAFAECHGLTSVTIPAGVISIGSLAFDECSGMNSITVDAGNPEYSSLDGVLFNKPKTTLIQYPAGRYGDYSVPGSVTRIEDWAFQSCDGLTGVVIPASVTDIGAGAFHDCWGLTNVSVPASVLNIGQSAFSDLHGALAIVVDAANPNYSSLDGVLFDKLKSLLIQYPPAKAGAYTIPSSVASIGDEAFTECYKLTAVNIPPSVTSIGSWAFSDCAELTTVVIPASVTSIGVGPFGACAKLASITVDSSNPNFTSTDGVLFDKSQSLIIQHPGGKGGTYTIPASVTSIGDGAFDGCGLLTGMTIPASVTSIGGDPPEGCTSLLSIAVAAGNPVFSSEDGVLFDHQKTSIYLYPGGRSGSYTIPASITSIADGAFGYCGGLTSITVAAGNVNYSSEDGLLFDKAKTTLIQCPGGKHGVCTIPSGVTTIGEDAFYQCRGLTNVSIPASMRIIGTWPFEECNGLASITVDAGNPGYSSVDGVLFDKQGTMLLRYPSGKEGSYTLPVGITRIGDGAFYQCIGLPSVAIPASVSSIGEGAFYECVALERAGFLGNAPSMSWGVFDVSAPGFTVYYFNGASGFTSPTWMGYPAVNMGDPSSRTAWLVSNGLDYDADLQSDPNGDGVNLLLAYALNLNPNENLADDMPRPVISGNQMSLTYYAGNGDVICTVETSTDLRFWTTDGVFVSASNPDGLRTASVLMTAPQRFLRLAVGRFADPTTPDGFSLIPAGSFQMGDQSNPLVGYSNEQPVHSVYVSAFYMGKYEVTKELWDEVRAWGMINGYTDLSTGGGKAANHPVHSITWHDMVKWCNARSQKEGLSPCYTVAGVTYQAGSSTPDCNWSASGYRLPSEAEWEKAARGGLSGKNFPWGDTINHSQANYYAYSGDGYDLSGAVNNYHPTYATGAVPYTSPVGSFVANGYGLYDMAGNMWELCWDWYGSYEAGSQTDPRGVSSGSFRVFRGGSWSHNADYGRVARRYVIYPGYYDYGSIGFRVARSSVP